jgi:hypothetical protein
MRRFCHFTKIKSPPAFPDQQRERVNCTAMMRLLRELKDNCPAMEKKVVTAVLTEEFHVTHSTIKRFWAHALQNFKDPTIKRVHR